MIQQLSKHVNKTILSIEGKVGKGVWRELHNKQGVYFIMGKYNKVLYIGRSGNLYTRLISHYSKRGMLNILEWDRIDIVYTLNHIEAEKYFILHLNPIYNGNISQRLF